MRKFIRTKEDFICENCGQTIIGDGYTNHCPNCLYSKHVDINPGDRTCVCHGLMEPIAILQKNSEYILLHKCVKCGFERKNKFSENDCFDSLLELRRKLNKK